MTNIPADHRNVLSDQQAETIARKLCDPVFLSEYYTYFLHKERTAREGATWVIDHYGDLATPMASANAGAIGDVLGAIASDALAQEHNLRIKSAMTCAFSAGLLYGKGIMDAVLAEQFDLNSTTLPPEVIQAMQVLSSTPMSVFQGLPMQFFTTEEDTEEEDDEDEPEPYI